MEAVVNRTLVLLCVLWLAAPAFAQSAPSCPPLLQHSFNRL